MSDSTTFGIFAVVFGVGVLLTAPLLLDANAKAIRKSSVFRGRGVDRRWASSNRFIVCLVGVLAVLAGIAALLGLLPE